MNVLQDKIHIIAKADPRYPNMKKQLKNSDCSSVIESLNWMLWIEIYYDAMLSLYNDCKKEGLKSSCEELKNIFKLQASFDRTLSKNASLMERYKDLYS